tara:strand:+ start:513 stop:953 length:441 start_codon:yes stop_codon:yes gene_type:complete
MATRIDYADKVPATKKYSPVDKPDSAIVDCAILGSFANATSGTKTRAEIIKAVTEKMQGGWQDLFPKWFQDYDQRSSYFERTVSFRLLALTKVNLLIVDSTAVYRLSPTVTDEDWVIVNGINAITPNPSMKLFKTRSGIKNLLGIK